MADNPNPCALKDEYEMVREHIRHEDELTNHRMTWMLTAQGGVVATVGALFASYISKDSTTQSRDGIFVLLILVLVVANRLYSIIKESIGWANAQHVIVRNWWYFRNHNKEHASHPSLIPNANRPSTCKVETLKDWAKSELSMLFLLPDKRWPPPGVDGESSSQGLGLWAGYIACPEFEKHEFAKLDKELAKRFPPVSGWFRTRFSFADIPRFLRGMNLWLILFACIVHFNARERGIGESGQAGPVNTALVIDLSFMRPPSTNGSGSLTLGKIDTLDRASNSIVELIYCGSPSNTFQIRFGNSLSK